MGTLRVRLGKSLQHFREAAKLTQERLAKKAGIEYKYLADLEHGRKSVSLEVLERLMEALDVEPFEMFSFSLRGGRTQSGGEEKLVGDLLRLAHPMDRRLVITLLKGVLRWRRAESP